MVNNLKIQVLRPSSCSSELKLVYSNTLSIDDCLDFDFKSLIKGLRLLYPQENTFITLTF